MNKYNYVIIGNSAGGIGAVEAIREVDKTNTIALISDEPYSAYSRPLISYLLAEKVKLDDIYLRKPNFYEDNSITTFFGIQATNIDFNQKKVALKNGKIVQYEKLLLATGGTPFVPDMPGLDKNGVFRGFNTLDTTLELQKTIIEEKRLRAVILGGGLIGLKAAEALKMKGLDVIVVELLDRLMPLVIDQSASQWVETVLENQGIKIITGNTISAITGKISNPNEVGGVILKNGSTIRCDIVVVAIGVRPRIEVVKESGLEVNRGILVNKRMETSIPDVYACGDCAEVYDFIMDSFRLTPLWPTAFVGGRIAGFNMAGECKEYHWGTSMNSTTFFGFPIISAGIINLSEEEKSDYEILSQNTEKFYKSIILKENKIMGFVLANEINRAGIFLGLMRNKIDVSEFKEDLLSENFGLIHLSDQVRNDLLAKEDLSCMT
ncbi:MAG: NAD(P)/FAD-dependent oxidoreductase [Promethearchaeota archaeon]